MIILPVVLYGCETWSVTLREKHRVSVFENRVLRRIFGPKRDKVTGEWRRLCKEKLQALTPHQILFRNQIKKNEMGRAYRTYEGKEKCILKLVEEAEGRRPLRRP
jgi:hypothetical protein